MVEKFDTMQHCIFLVLISSCYSIIVMNEKLNQFSNFIWVRKVNCRSILGGLTIV